jgi:cytochrome c553
MFKILLPLLFIIVTFTYAAEDSYVFEAKGAFAKELKALVEKYSKEGKIEAKVYKKDDGIISTILGGSTSNQDGKALYVKKCASCHGQKGEEGAGAGSRLLKDMTADEIEYSMSKYKRDNHFGGSMKALMHNVSVALRGTDIKAITSYIKGTYKPDSKSSTVKNNDKVESSYLQ